MDAVTLGAARAAGDKRWMQILANGAAPAPSAPTAVVAKANATAARVSWSRSQQGGQSQTFTVTATPGGRTATTTSTSVVVTGLSNGTAYTFTVTAANGAGASAPSSASNSVTPTAGPGALAIPDLMFWLDAAQTTGFADGASVAAAPDSSGNGNPASATFQPTYKASWTNGAPAFQFSGNKQGLTTALSQSAIGSRQTSFVVFALIGSTNSEGARDMRLLDDEIGTATLDQVSFHLDTFAGAGNAARMGAASGPTASSAALSLATPYVASVTSPGLLYLNGAASAANINGPNATRTYPYMVGSIGGASQPRSLNGYIAEVIIFGRVLTAAERHSIESYLGTKYAVTMAVQ